MLSVDIVQAIARLKRAFPRNADVLAVCDALETRQAAPIVDQAAEGFDRRAYQRDYMRKRRAKA
jgi:hypothetical protein